MLPVAGGPVGYHSPDGGLGSESFSIRARWLTWIASGPCSFSVRGVVFSTVLLLRVGSTGDGLRLGTMPPRVMNCISRHNNPKSKDDSNSQICDDARAIGCVIVLMKVEMD